MGSGRLNSAEAVRIAYEMTLVIDNDNNNGHGNSDGFDPSNPGYDNSHLFDNSGKLVMMIDAVDFISINLEMPGVYYLISQNETKK